MKVRILAGDICTFPGDVVVNATNNKGLGGGGVDGAIHRAAGPLLRDACVNLPVLEGMTGLGSDMTSTDYVRVPTGGAIPTPAFNMPCKWLIHTAGPVWPPDAANNLLRVQAAKKALGDCYRKPMLVALAMGLKSLAYPAISTGMYGCPQKTCAKIALNWVLWYHNVPLDVTFYIFPEQPNLAIWQEVAHRLGVPLT